MKGLKAWRGIPLLLIAGGWLAADALHNSWDLLFREIGEPERTAWKGPQQPATMPALRPAPTVSAQMTVLAAEPHRDPGHLEGSLVTYQRVLEQARRAGDLPRVGAALNNLGTAYLKIGETDRAIDYSRRALEINSQVESPREQASSLSNLGSALQKAGERAAASDIQERALALLRRLGDRQGEARSLINLGTLAAGTDMPRALDLYREALALARQLKDVESEAQATEGIAGLELQRGSPEEALIFYEEALVLRRQLGDRSGEATTLLGIARAQRRLGRLDEAMVRIEQALAIVESLRTDLASPDLRASFLASKQSLYEFAVDLSMELDRTRPGRGFAAAAFQISERARARSLLDMLAESGVEIRAGVAPQLLQRERSLVANLHEKERKRLELLRESGSSAALAEVEHDLTRLLDQYSTLTSELRASSPRYTALTRPELPTLREVQSQLLDEDTVLLAYALGEERSFLWTVTPDSVSAFELPPRGVIESAARRFYEAVSSSRLQVARGSAEAAARFLGRILLGPAVSRLGSKRLLIVADGALQFVPFAALLVEDGGPLLRDHEIVMLPSASILAVLRRERVGRPDPPKLLAVLADPVLSAGDSRLAGRGGGSADVVQPTPALRAVEPTDLASLQSLPFSREEAENILALVPSDMRFKAVGFDASRAMVLSGGLSGYRFVHFATHGLIDSRHPELSSIVLSMFDPEGRPQDGRLRLHEIYNLSLQADLVVLSACQTGLGKEIRGEGLVGLVRGFLYAGASRVIASLWNVDDKATAELMKRFYRGLIVERLSPAAALRKAQLSMLADSRWDAPFYWAGFTLQGEW